MKIRDLLKIKDRRVVTVGPDETISAAVKKLAEYDRGSLPVCNEKGELVGIVTERDVVRKCFASVDACAGFRVKDVMTSRVAIAIPDDGVEYAISVMKQKRIRHLPVVEDQRVVGMVSMRDLLDMQLSETSAEVRYAGLLPRRPQRPVV
ncbi:MAG: CBS domain-containing protein [Chloroflexi bacterium]|nr:CBS domain-containing protein [Chloroflexota bacterium]